MTTLILLLPPRGRLRAQGTSQPEGQSEREYDYVLSADGVQVQAQGRCSAALLPRARQVIAVPAEADISWHHAQLPRVARKQLRAALAGTLEEALLDDPDRLHFATEPEAQAGGQAWVAVMHKAWLLEHLAALERAQVFVDRLAPLSWPAPEAQGHFFMTGSPAGDASELGLSWRHADGASTLRLNGSLARDLLPDEQRQAARWTGVPAAVAAAEHWLGAAVAPQSEAERALGVLQSPWNLRQFELAARTRGLRALREVGRELMSPRWRPLRWGVAGLVLVQLLGLNLWAWQQRQQIDARRQALNTTLSTSFPQVRAILDAPLQMQRETALLRTAAGRAGEQDLETLLAAAATAWPAERGPVDALGFEPGKLMISANGWSEPQIEQFRRQLQSEGWRLDLDAGRMSLSRAP
jgi:general secretion pathway protein L